MKGKYNRKEGEREREGGREGGKEEEREGEEFAVISIIFIPSLLPFFFLLFLCFCISLSISISFIYFLHLSLRFFLHFFLSFNTFPYSPIFTSLNLPSTYLTIYPPHSLLHFIHIFHIFISSYHPFLSLPSFSILPSFSLLPVSFFLFTNLIPPHLSYIHLFLSLSIPSLLSPFLPTLSSLSHPLTLPLHLSPMFFVSHPLPFRPSLRHRLLQVISELSRWDGIKGL